LIYLDSSNIKKCKKDFKNVAVDNQLFIFNMNIMYMYIMYIN